MRANYRSLPDTYWEGNADAFITPERYDKMTEVVQEPSNSSSAKLWEICSGSSSLSSEARADRLPHMPPVDLRYGWFTARAYDQMLILHGLLVVGVLCLFVAPNCALWGNMTHNMAKALLESRRA